MVGGRVGRSRLALLAALVVAVVAAGCGGGSTAQQRIDRCVEGNLGLQSNGDAVAADVSKRSLRMLCGASERAGYLDDQGRESAEQGRLALQANVDMLVPFCRAALATTGTDPGVDVSYLPKGGMNALTTRYCGNLRAYINAKGNGIDEERLWRDRGGGFTVPICVATALTKVAKQGGVDWDRLASSRPT